MKRRTVSLALGDGDEDILLVTMGDLHGDAGLGGEAGGLELRGHAADGSLALGAAGEFLDAGIDLAYVADEAARAGRNSWRGRARWRG